MDKFFRIVLRYYHFDIVFKYRHHCLVLPIDNMCRYGYRYFSLREVTDFP